MPFRVCGGNEGQLHGKDFNFRTCFCLFIFFFEGGGLDLLSDSSFNCTGQNEVTKGTRSATFCSSKKKEREKERKKKETFVVFMLKMKKKKRNGKRGWK